MEILQGNGEGIRYLSYFVLVTYFFFRSFAYEFDRVIQTDLKGDVILRKVRKVLILNQKKKKLFDNETYDFTLLLFL